MSVLCKSSSFGITRMALRGSTRGRESQLMHTTCVKAAAKFSTDASVLVSTEIDYDSGVAKLSLNKAPVNSLSLEMCQAISKSIKKIEDEKHVHVMVLSSTLPTTFSAGLDIMEMYNPDQNRLVEFWESFQQLHLDLYSSRLACVAAMKGHAVAGGCIVAMSCDVRIMSSNPKYKIGLNETKLGIVPSPWIAQLFVSTIGHRQAEMGLSLGTLFSPSEALRVGLVDEIANDDEIMVRAQKAAVRWNMVPSHARHASKMLSRKEHVDRLIQNRTDDVDLFCNTIQQDSVQENIGLYLESLKKK